MIEIQRRRFTALQHPKGSPERDRLNLDAETSEYMPSHKYLVRQPLAHPTQAFIHHTVRTKREAKTLAARLETTL